MDLRNSTPYRAALFTGFLGPSEAVGTIVVRRTMQLGEDGVLAEDPRAWPILTEPLRTDVGTFPSDMVPGHAGCDLVITGVLRRNAPVTTAEVQVAAGAFSARLDVIGDRIWRAKGGDLVPSDPLPFTEMPLVWERAFGGKSEFEGMEAPHILNKEGCGFYLQREEAEGRPLPNLEWPDQRILRWDDRPTPACFAPAVDPLTWHLARLAEDAARASTPEERDVIVASAPERSSLSACQPRMIAPALGAGDPVLVEGLLEAPLRFEVPHGEPTVTIDPGAGSFDVPLACSGMFLLLEQKLVVLTYRAEFRYRYQRRTARRAILSEAPSAPGGD